MNNWFEQAKAKKARLEAQGLSYSYNDISKEFGVHYDTVRKKFRDDRKRGARGGLITPTNIVINPIIDNASYLPKDIVEKFKTNLVSYKGFPGVPISKEEPISTEVPLQDRVMDILKKGAKLEELCEQCKIKPLVAKAVIADIKEQGYNLFEAGDFVKISKVAIPSSNTVELSWDGSSIRKFGIVSDTHLGSKYQQLTHLNSLYDTFAKEKIDTVFHIGDISEGVGMRKGHEYELFILGVDGQADYCIEKYPHRDGITTEFITGNHDHSGIKSAGADIGKRIAKERSDMVYLGLSNTRIKITPNCTMELNHGLDGASYALSYTLQKCLDSLDNSDLPDIFLNGHHHKLMYTYYRNIHALECGTLQAQTPWMKGKRLAAHVGGIILTVHVDSNGKVLRFIPEFIPFYSFKEKDY